MLMGNFGNIRYFLIPNSIGVQNSLVNNENNLVVDAISQVCDTWKLKVMECRMSPWHELNQVPVKKQHRIKLNLFYFFFG